MKELISIMTSKYNHGESLINIYNMVLEAYGESGKDIFLKFCQYKKEDSKFMKEFNKTSFVNNITTS